MKSYDQNKESSYPMHLNSNNLYGQAISQKLPGDGFEWFIKNYENVIKNYDKHSDIGYIFKVDTEYPKRLENLHNDLPFLPERMKIKKCKKLVCNLYDKNNYVAHVRTLKQALNRGLIF